MLGEGGGYEWIRVDPECEWIAIFEFVERPWYWISQLQGDRDVVAQIEAIHNLTLNLSPVVASEFARTVLVENYYYRVRIEAVKALVLVSEALIVNAEYSAIHRNATSWVLSCCSNYSTSCLEHRRGG